jgi:hypothetical protein
MLVSASDEDLIEKLVAVRGLGRWSVEMFACFGLKRMDVFSTGDLGVQYVALSLPLPARSPSDSYDRKGHVADVQDPDEAWLFTWAATSTSSKTKAANGSKLASHFTPFLFELSQVLASTRFNKTSLPSSSFFRFPTTSFQVI